MRLTSIMVVLALVAPTLAGATEVIDRRDDRPGVFPVIEATTLQGRKVRLPDQLKGERNLLLVAYEREQQAEVDTWLTALASFEAKPPAFAYYELPCISGGMKWMRAVIDGGMKQGIPDRKQRDRVITLYLDVDWLRAQIGTAERDDIAALLVDRDGVVQARWFGPCNDDALAQLATALAPPGGSH